VGRAVATAKAAQREWAHRPWRERVATLRKAASLIRERKFELAAIMALEVGKSRLEAMGDAEESADLIDYYCQELEDANGFVRQMAKVTAVERNTDVLRPYGVFACIAPFNFPLALSTGMSAAALVTGNAVVYKPAEDTPWTGLKLYEVYRDSGVPAGAFNYIPGSGEVTGEALWRHPGIDGSCSRARRPWACASIRASPPMDQAVPARDGREERGHRDGHGGPGCGGGSVTRSAFGLQNQKCSATSRVYVHQRVASAFIEKLIETTKALRLATRPSGMCIRAGDQRGRSRALHACGRAGPSGRDGPAGR